MSGVLLRSPQSLDDVAAIIQHYIDVHTPASAIRFSQAVATTLDLLTVFPESGPSWESDDPELQGVRFQNVHGYPNYLIFYRLIDEGLYVIRIVDGRRDLDRVLADG